MASPPPDSSPLLAPSSLAMAAAAAAFRVAEVVDKGSSARCGELLGMETPLFSIMTSNLLPLYLRPETLGDTLEGKLLYDAPVGDLLLRKALVEQCPKAQDGCRGFWPHLRDHVVLCPFRNVQVNPSVFGGDSICQVHSLGGRRKVGPKELIELQRAMRVELLAAPGEELSLDVPSTRRSQRTVARAGEWLKEICEAKTAAGKDGASWHILASIQGGGDHSLRRKACAAAAEEPIAGVWIGGLGYGEALAVRGELLGVVDAALPREFVRALPLNEGNPIEVLQAVLFGVDVLEVPYPTQAAAAGIALTFEYEMPTEGVPSDEEAAKLLQRLRKEAEAEDSEVCAPLEAVRQLYLREESCREDFSPICPGTPVPQYSRAYLYHLHEVHELLGTMLLVRHNLHRYSRFFREIRRHIREGSFQRYAAWFLATQTCKAPPAPAPGTGAGAVKKRRKA